MTVAKDFLKEHYEDEYISRRRRVKILTNIYEEMSKRNIPIAERIRFKNYFNIEQEIQDLQWYTAEIKKIAKQ